MAVEAYQNPYDDQINAEQLEAERKEIEASQGLFENQDMVKIIKTYLEESVPNDIKDSDMFKEFWAVMGKKIQLTFLNDEDKFEFEAMFQQAKMAHLMSQPSYRCDFKKISTMKQIELYFNAALRSAIGTKHQKVNERMALVTAITQNIRSNTETFNASKKQGGWLSRLF